MYIRNSKRGSQVYSQDILAGPWVTVGSIGIQWDPGFPSAALGSLARPGMPERKAQAMWGGSQFRKEGQSLKVHLCLLEQIRNQKQRQMA